MISLRQTPFAFLGAVGLLGLVNDLLQYNIHIQNWVDAWVSVTRPAIDFVFGWIFNLVNIDFPNILKDYISAGFILSFSLLRSINYDIFGEFWWTNVLAAIIFVFVWPVGLIFYAYLNFFDGTPEDREKFLVFMESIVLALIIVAVGYIISSI